MLLVLRFLLPPRDGFLVAGVDRFQGDQVFAPEGGNLRHHHGLQSLSFADFDAQFLRHSLVGIVPHRAHRLADVRFREHAQKGRFGKFDFESFVQRVVEDGIAGLVDEARQEDDVGLGQRGPSEKDAPRDEGGDDKERATAAAKTTRRLFRASGAGRDGQNRSRGVFSTVPERAGAPFST